MYLSDREILAHLAEMNIESDAGAAEFNPDEQVQPCSIDLRLSNVFWEPVRGAKVDLRKSALLNIQPRRFWKKRVLRPNEYITLKPGKLLLGRVSEKFTVPSTCAGKIQGRSSFARMGLSIHCTGDFINPGYRGHMPLELVNHGVNPIKIFPFIPICQLVMNRLTSEPIRKYGHQELQSKYSDDDGGPSYWWRDKRIRELQCKFHDSNVELHVQEQILAKVGIQEPEVIERFESLLEKIQDKHGENAQSLLEKFAKSEDFLKKRYGLVSALGKSLLIICIGGAIGQRSYFFNYPWSSYLIWFSCLASIWPFIWALTDTPRQYFCSEELRRLSKS